VGAEVVASSHEQLSVLGAAPVGAQPPSLLPGTAQGFAGWADPDLGIAMPGLRCSKPLWAIRRDLPRTSCLTPFHTDAR